MTGTICSVDIYKSNAVNAKKNNKQIRFFGFPKDKLLRKKWVQLCYRKDIFESSNKQICSKHFDLDQYEDVIHAKLTNTLPKKLKETAIPSLDLIPTTLPEVESTDRSKRQEIKERKTLVQELLKQQSEVVTLNEIPNTSAENSYTVLEQQMITILKENELLKDKVSQQENYMVGLKKKIDNLENIIQESTRDVERKARELLVEFLTPNQIDLVLKKKTKARWTADELSQAFTVRYFSQRAYIYLRQKLKYLLPGISTLQHWASNINLRQGLLHDILKMMVLYGKDKTDRQKLTVLSFDEIKVSSMIEYDQKLDEIVGPHNYMQVIMARELFDSWKQPVFVGFDTKMTLSLLEEVITELNKINYNVIACISDCGGGNMGLWKDLNITIEKTYCLHPVTKEKNFVFADIPHMLKLTRNWFLDYGFILEDEKIITKEPVEYLINQRATEISSCHKLTQFHITCEKSQKQNGTLAAQLLSHTTATALQRYLPGSNKQLARNVGDFFDLVSKWFDIMNSYTPSASVITKVPFGRNLPDQIEILNEMKRTFKTMKVISKNSLQLFQKGIIISTTSLQDIYKDLSVKHNISYILTHRLNQDCLENLFAQIRTRGGLHDHPAPLNALNRLRMILLGKNPGVVQKNVNVLSPATKEVIEKEFIVKHVLKQAQINSNLEIEDEHLSEENVSDTSSISTEPTVDDSIQTLTEKDGLRYIAGYLAKRHKKDYPNLGVYTYQDVEPTLHTYSTMPSWVKSLSFGGLTEPSPEWLENVEHMDKYFVKVHKDNFKFKKMVVLKTTNYIF